MSAPISKSVLRSSYIKPRRRRAAAAAAASAGPVEPQKRNLAAGADVSAAKRQKLEAVARPAAAAAVAETHVKEDAKGVTADAFTYTLCFMHDSFGVSEHLISFHTKREALIECIIACVLWRAKANHWHRWNSERANEEVFRCVEAFRRPGGVSFASCDALRAALGALKTWELTRLEFFLCTSDNAREFPETYRVFETPKLTKAKFERFYGLEPLFDVGGPHPAIAAAAAAAVAEDDASSVVPAPAAAAAAAASQAPPRRPAAAAAAAVEDDVKSVTPAPAAAAAAAAAPKSREPLAFRLSTDLKNDKWFEIPHGAVVSLIRKTCDADGKVYSETWDRVSIGAAVDVLLTEVWNENKSFHIHHDNKMRSLPNAGQLKFVSTNSVDPWAAPLVRDVCNIISAPWSLREAFNTLRAMPKYIPTPDADLMKTLIFQVGAAIIHSDLCVVHDEAVSARPFFFVDW